MEAIEIIKRLREKNFTVKADGQYLDLAPAEKVTDELIQRLRKHKPAILKELQREERYKNVLEILAANLDSHRAISSDLDSDPDDVILTIAIRDKYTFEMLVPKYRFDSFLILELIEKGSLQ